MKSVEQSESLRKVELDAKRRGLSDVTLSNCMINIGYFCCFLNLSPDEIVERMRNGVLGVEDVQNFIDHYNIELGRTPGTLKQYFAAVKKFLVANGIDLDWNCIYRGLVRTF